MTELWYNPREIVFDRAQVIWLLRHYLILQEGIWPRQQYSAEPGSGTRIRSQGHFCSAVEVLTELDERLKKLGNDAQLLLIQHYALDMPLGKCGWFQGLSSDQAYRRIKISLHLISGYKRKRYQQNQPSLTE